MRRWRRSPRARRVSSRRRRDAARHVGVGRRTDIATFDDRVRELLGLTDENARSRASIIETRIHPDDRERLNAALMRAADPSGDGRFQGEYRIVHDDGSERWALAFGRMHFAGEGEARQRGAAHRDGPRHHGPEARRGPAAPARAARARSCSLRGDETDRAAASRRCGGRRPRGLGDRGCDRARTEPRDRAAMAHVDAGEARRDAGDGHSLSAGPVAPTLGREALATGRRSSTRRSTTRSLAAMARDAEQARLARGDGNAVGDGGSVADARRAVRHRGVRLRAADVHRATISRVAEEIGRRASLAVENARLIAAAKRAQDDAERAARRTARLQTLSAALASALTPNDVATAAVREGVAAVGADAGLLVLVSPDGRDARRGGGARLRPATRRAMASLPASTPRSARGCRPDRRAVVVSSTEERERRYPALADTCRSTYPAIDLRAAHRRRAELRRVRPELPRADHRRAPEDRELLLAVARQCAQAVRRATLFDAEGVARAAAEAAGRRLAFLADASAALASLDYETTLQRVAQLAVPSFADYVVIDLLDENGAIAARRVGARDPAKAPLLRRTARYYPSGEPRPASVSRAAGEGTAGARARRWTSSGFGARRGVRSTSRRCGRFIRESLIMAPLSARGHTLGVMTFVLAEPGASLRTRPTSRSRLKLARRAAVAVDNARLYRESESARHDAEAASRAKGQFLAVMSHELRTPLNAILGYSELVDMGVHGAVTDAQREAMARIRRSGQHLLSLVNNVLNLERAEVGGLRDGVRDAAGRTTVRGCGCADSAAGGGEGDHADGRHAAGDAERARRAGEGGSGARESAVERGEVHAGGRPDHAHVRRYGRTSVALRVTDSGVGIPADCAGADLRAVRATGQRPNAARRGCGARVWRSAAGWRGSWAETSRRRVRSGEGRRSRSRWLAAE